MEYSTADTIATRLSKLNPWQFDEHTRSWPTPMHSCIYCHYGRYVNEPNMYNTHDPACLWVAAARYADDLDNASVASQEPAESPIESRVSELLGETEDDTWAVCGTYGKCGKCSICIAWAARSSSRSNARH